MTQAKVIADLHIKAMLFSMDIDWESLDLVPKTVSTDAVWFTRWKEKEATADNMSDGSDWQGWE